VNPLDEPMTIKEALADKHVEEARVEKRVSLLAAALPQFEITVQDPVKKSEGLTSYMIYTINTKTSSPEFKPSSNVQRRFNHFVWLFNELTNANPGVIVPPIADKQALGRFDSEFVDSRRIALERFLRRVVANPALYTSSDLKIFLEADNMEAAISSKKKEKSQSKGGFFQSLTSSLNEVVTNTAQTFAKIPERDEWFENKRGQLEMLESQLKALYKCVETVVKQRKELAVASGDFGESMASLATSEPNKPLANAFSGLNKVQQKVRELYNEQATQDDLLFGNTVDEYVRTMGSIKLVLQARSKAFAAMQTAEKTLINKRETLEKARTQPAKAAKVPGLEKEVEEAEEAESKAKREFEDISKLIREELVKFDDEKVLDFQKAMQAFVESMMETQKKTIELWKEYLPEVQALSQVS